MTFNWNKNASSTNMHLKISFGIFRPFCPWGRWVNGRIWVCGRGILQDTRRTGQIHATVYMGQINWAIKTAHVIYNSISVSCSGLYCTAYIHFSSVFPVITNITYTITFLCFVHARIKTLKITLQHALKQFPNTWSLQDTSGVQAYFVKNVWPRNYTQKHKTTSSELAK